MVFNTKTEEVIAWEFAQVKPAEEIIEAMILAYRWMKVWIPIKMFIRLIKFWFIRGFSYFKRNLRQIIYTEILKKSDQLKLS